MRSALLLLALSALGIAQTPQPPVDALRSTFILSGNNAGQQSVWTTPDGVTHVAFEFNDRGRGPSTVTDYRLDAHKTVLSLHTTGHDYLKSSADETFSRGDSGTTTWQNRSETATRAASSQSHYLGNFAGHPGPSVPDTFYLGMFSPPEEGALLIRAALANHGSIQLLPSGEATVHRELDLNLEADGKHAHVTEYAVTGLDFAPQYLWLDDDGHLFASADFWSGLIRAGFESKLKTLTEAQQRSEVERSRLLASKLMHHSPSTLLHNVAIFDSVNATLVAAQDVLITGNRISSVKPTVASPHESNSTLVIEGNGRVLIPGLWDLHAHVGANDGLLNLAAGVTTVRDMGNDIDDLTARRKRIDAGEEIGTRIIACGLIDGPGPFQGPTKILASNEKEARDYVDQFAALGYPQMKIYSSMNPDLVPVIIDEARKHHMRVSGHIPAGMTAAQAVSDGYDEIQHANFLMLNFWPEVKNTETPARFTEVAKRGADLELTSPQVRDFIQFLKDHHTDLDVTLNVFEEMFTAENGKPSPIVAPVADRLPPTIVRNSLSVALPDASSDQRQRSLESFAKMEKLVKMMYDAGIPIESGTDALAGFSYDRELELHQQIGIPPARILADATLTAAHIMSKDADLGSITAGKLADVVLLDADPTQNISNVRQTSVVIKDGVVYYPAELDRELGIKPR
ncbi:MAG TPA: amidohydrolase family protein [Candidatus Koribacter sp.]|jgi:imidazolonepropionase-like amidohydrolase